MISRRGLLKAIFGTSLSAVTRSVGALVEALTTRKTSDLVLSAVTGEQIRSAKMFFFPAIELVTLMPPVRIREHFYGEGRLT